MFYVNILGHPGDGLVILRDVLIRSNPSRLPRQGHLNTHS